MAVCAVLIARFASRGFGLRFGWPFAERSRLAFASAKSFLETTSKIADQRFEFSDALRQSTATRTFGIGHADSLANRPSFSCASWQKNQGLNQAASK